MWDRSEVKIGGFVNVFVVFVIAGCIVYVSCSNVIYCCFVLCSLFVCNVCYLSVVLLYYCDRVKAQLQFNIYIYIYILNILQPYRAPRPVTEIALLYYFDSVCVDIDRLCGLVVTVPGC
jgi:hypothetical protein